MKLSKSLFSGQWGIEREVLRVDLQGRLSTRPHPFPPGDKKITVDFAEAQAELITGVHSTPVSALDELEELQTKLESAMGDEVLWPFSVPGVWSDEQRVEPAQFAGEPQWEAQRRYRKTLIDRHGAARQVISGIHLNYSFGPDHPGGDYFALVRNFLRYQPILTYLLAGSPWFGPEFRDQLSHNRTASTAERSRSCSPWTASVRQGALGYSLSEEVAQAIDVRFDSLGEYLGKLNRALSPQNGKAPLIGHEREFYAPVRPKGKTQDKGETLKALAQSGVSYLEFRSFDLDPLASLGIQRDSLLFMELFLLACTVVPSPLLTPADIRRTRQLGQTLAQCSLKGKPGVSGPVRVLWSALAPTLEELAELGGEDHRLALRWFRLQIEGRMIRGIDRVAALWKNGSALRWGLDRAQLHKSWRGLELSTRLLVEEADRRGIRVTLVDAQDNFLLLEKDGRKEFVKQATRTSADTYISALIMENKAVTKRVLARGGLNVPDGRELGGMDEVRSVREAFHRKKAVVKPNATNFGDGVSILEPGSSEQLWESAFKLAFSLDRKVLVEEFAPGLEFRFLVIGGQTRAVLHRVPANVVGDGESDLRTLVDQKNRHPWRGEGYRRPLEKLRLDEAELNYVAGQGLTPESVPASGRRVFLRQNSNISTGGDSIDFTDSMPPVYKAVAERAVGLVGAQVCGLDMIIPDWKDDSPGAAYTILELNFNPALHIHAFPFEGKNRRGEAAVLDLLGLGSEPESRSLSDLGAGFWPMGLG